MPRRIHRRALPLALCAAGLLSAAAGAQERVPIETIAAGLQYARYEVEGVLAHVLRVDLTQKDLEVRSLKADGKETIQTMVDRLNASGERVAGAINGDFFHTGSAAGVPFGIQVSDGRLVFGPRKRSVLGFTPEKQPAIGVVDLEARIEVQATKRYKLAIDGVNAIEDDMSARTSAYLYTPAFKKLSIERFAGLVAVIDTIEPALRVGESCEGIVSAVELATSDGIDVPKDGCLVLFLGEHARTLRAELKPRTKIAIDIALPPIRGAIAQAIGGGPRLVRAGKTSIEFDKEDFAAAHVAEIDKKRHPRSAVGYDRARKTLYLVVVEGRQKDIVGMRMDELAAFMLRIGCHEAMGFDGGGSAAMYVLGRGLVSTSVGGGGAVEEREIANSLVITMPRKVDAPKPTFLRDEPQ